MLEDGQLVELHEDKGNQEYAVGDIYLGRVKKVLPSLNAGFVDIGHPKDAFLHYLDLGPQYRSSKKLRPTFHQRNPSELRSNQL